MKRCGVMCVLISAACVAWLVAVASAQAADETYGEWVVAPAAKSWPATTGAKLSSAELIAVAEASKAPLPYLPLTCGVRLPDGQIWAGTQGGLVYWQPGAARWRLFHSRRYLPGDEVRDVAVTADRTVHVQTSAGPAALDFKQTTLAAKMDEIHAALRQMHLRVGLVGDINLREPGNVAAGGEQPSSDNDGLWTSLYVVAEAFRYGATGDEQAKRNAYESLQALMFLERVTGISGFAARSVWPVEAGEAQKMFGGEWHRSADGKWWWKGDTSSDELDGHYWAYAVYYDLCADEPQREEIRGYVARITDHILDHGYYYVGPSGKPTRWGVFAPEKLNQDLRWIDDRGLNSLEMLSHLKVAEHVTGNAKYAEAARQLNEVHAYAANTVLQKWIWPPSSVNHSDDELAFSVYYPLLRYERDARWLDFYFASLERSWQIERPERSPLFNYIYAACRQAHLPGVDPLKRPMAAGLDGKDYDHDECLAWFRDVPADTIHWTVRNSARQDIGQVLHNRFDNPRALVVLPPSERPLMRWNGDPYTLDGGADGRARDDGTYILLPYWMGRYHRFLD